MNKYNQEKRISLLLLFITILPSFTFAAGIINMGTADSIERKYKIIEVPSLVFPLDQAEYVLNNLMQKYLNTDTAMVKKINEELSNTFKNNKDVLMKISKYLVFDDFPNTKFLEINSHYTKGLGPSVDIVLCIDETSKKVVRYKGYDFEKTKLTFNLIKEKDVDNFNKMIKVNKLKFQSINEILNLCVVFINIVYSQMPSEVVFSVNHINEKLRERFQPIVSKPKYREYSNKFFIELYSVSESGYLISLWNFEVFKNGKIKIKFARCLY